MWTTGGSSDTLTYGYTNNNQLTSVTHTNNTFANETFSWDANGNQTGSGYTTGTGNEQTASPGYTYTYDANGNMLAATQTSTGDVWTYTYDFRNLMTSAVEKNSSGTILAQANFTYDALGNRIGMNENGVQTWTLYDGSDPVMDFTGGGASRGQALFPVFGRSTRGLRGVKPCFRSLRGQTEEEFTMWTTGGSSDTLTYGYTNNNQLTSVTHTNNTFANETFSWDANGNQTGSGYTTGTGNEQTASPGYTYTYDADGNMLAATQTSTGDVWTYTYDFRNLMTSAVEKSAQGTVIAQATFTYDALGNRIGMNENGVQTWTLYDGSTPVMDFTSTGSLATRYLNGPAGDLVDTVLARELSNGTVAWYLSDHLGTVRNLINNTGGIIDHVDYSAFGTTLDESSPSNGDRMTGFAGLERDTVTGLNLATFRVQNPGTGRWTSQDPLGFSAGDSDLYRYGANAPVNLADPSGLVVISPTAIGWPPLLPPPPTPTAPWAGPSGVPLPPLGDIWNAKDAECGGRIADIVAQEAYKTFFNPIDKLYGTGDNREHGGWIYYNPQTGQYTTRIARRGNGATINLGRPPCVDGYVVVLIWHTHPGPFGPTHPSSKDRKIAKRHGVHGTAIGGPPFYGQPLLPSFYN